MRVREARPDDAVAIARINVTAWEAAYRGAVDDKALDDALSSDLGPAWQEVIEAPTEPGSTVLVAEESGRVIGYARLGPSRDDDTDRTTGEVYAMYVDPDHWGTAVSRVLFEQVEDRLREAGCRTARLWVLAANPRAIRFYEKSGWKHDGRDDKPFLGKERQLRYRKDLVSS